jgi:predicted amidohydrolase
MQVQIALAQMNVSRGCPEENAEAARDLVSRAGSRGADLVVLPELWPTGYDLDRASNYAAPLDEGAFGIMAEMARTHQVIVAGTALEANPGGLPFNTAAVYGPKGDRLGAYRKIHLFPLIGETTHMSPGNDLTILTMPWGPTALAICYDLRFPELWRRHAYAGAVLIVIPAEWPVRRIEHWRLLLRARAVENQLFVAGCNRAGGDTDGDFGGYSAVVDPWGQVVVEGGGEPDLLVATLDLDEVARVRDLFPFLEDQRPEVYG